MIKTLLLIALILLTSSCSQAEVKSSSIPPELLKQMRIRDFKSQITVIVHEGELKGEYVFEHKPEVRLRAVNISIKHEYGPGYKDEVLKSVNIFSLNVPQKDGVFALSLFEIGFDGLIKEGYFPVRPRQKGGKNPLRFLNESQDGKWHEAKGELQAKNSIELTYVGPWLDIRGKTEVRELEGTFKDYVMFEYSGDEKPLPTETVPVTIKFNGIQNYSPTSKG